MVDDYDDDRDNEPCATASRYHVRASHDINRLHRTRVRVNERVIDRIVIRRTILDALRTGHLMHVPSAWISRDVS